MNFSQMPNGYSIPNLLAQRSFRQKSRYSFVTARRNYAALKTAIKSLFAIVVGCMVMTIALWATLHLVSSSAQNGAIQPTAIPWLENEAECQTTGRVWQDGNCWDYQHSPDF